MYGTTRPASGGKLELFKQLACPNILLRLADFYLYYAEALMKWILAYLMLSNIWIGYVVVLGYQVIKS